MNNIASNSPIVREMVFRIISNFQLESKGHRHRIDSEIIPPIPSKIHSRISGFQESIIPIKSNQMVVLPSNPKVQVFNVPRIDTNNMGYGKISPLILDNSIISIEYRGENIPIKINRMGKFLDTNIVLSREEFDNILKHVSEKTRIPITNSVFRVAIDNILFNAVISDEIGRRFLIKKNFQISPDYSEAFK